MAGLLGATLVAVLAMVAPAATPVATGATKAQGSDVREARRLYSIGEAAMKAGKATEAVSLWRRAIVALPETEDYDELRHKLVLRLAFGLMAAAEQTRELGFAEDAARMLERYATRHEQLFGDGVAAEMARGEVYELLYEVESLIERGPGKPRPPAVADTPSAPARVDEGAPDGMERDVVVPSKRKLARPSIDDPKVRAKLTSRATNVETGLVLHTMDHGQIHPARGLVRMDGLVRPAGAAPDLAEHRELHALARAAFLSVRPALRACFDEAYARTPTAFVHTEAELVLEPDGSVSAVEIVGAPIIDRAGTTCVRERLADAQIPDSGPSARVRVGVPLLFFWQPAESAGGGGSSDGAGPAPRPPPRPGTQQRWTMGPIEGEDFASTRRQPNTW